MLEFHIDESKLVRAIEVYAKDLEGGFRGAVEFAVEAGAEEARETAKFNNVSGDARANIGGAVDTKFRGRGAHGHIYCNVPYASILNGGSKPHAIPNAFGRGFTANHPGTRPDGFMDRGAARARQVLIDEIEHAATIKNF